MISVVGQITDWARHDGNWKLTFERGTKRVNNWNKEVISGTISDQRGKSKTPRMWADRILPRKALPRIRKKPQTTGWENSRQRKSRSQRNGNIARFINRQIGLCLLIGARVFLLFVFSCGTVACELINLGRKTSVGTFCARFSPQKWLQIKRGECGG